MAKIWNMALIGGGHGSLIGPVHWKAATFSGQARLCGGIFSSDAKRSQDSALAYQLPVDRGFANFDELLSYQAKAAPEDKIDFVTIATPNHLHGTYIRQALENNLHVICDKPLCHNLEEAKDLSSIVRAHPDKVFALTHNYAGYPIIRYLRSLIMKQELGEIIAIRARYLQGWLATDLESSGHRQASWRTDPSRSGIAGAFADIGSHAFHLLRFVTGLYPRSISAHLGTTLPHRQLDDHGTALLRMDNGAMAHLTISQVSQGYRNHFVIEIDGREGSATWCQEEPEKLILRRNGSGDHTIFRHQLPGHSILETGLLPAGHPEGYIEAFANIYDQAYIRMQNPQKQTTESSSFPSLCPDMNDGLEVMNFITHAVHSSADHGQWIDFSKSEG